MQRAMTDEEISQTNKALVDGGYPAMMEMMLDLGLAQGYVNRWDDGSWEVFSYEPRGFSIMRGGPRFKKPEPVSENRCPDCGKIDPGECRHCRCCLGCKPPGSYSYYDDQCDDCGWYEWID